MFPEEETSEQEEIRDIDFSINDIEDAMGELDKNISIRTRSIPIYYSKEV